MGVPPRASRDHCIGAKEGPMKRSVRHPALFAVLTLCSPAIGRAQVDAAPSAVTLFENVRGFAGASPTLSPPKNVLVRGNKIERISAQPIAADPGADTRIIDGGGRTLMPGLIDVHWHAMFIRSTPTELLYGDVGFNNLAAGQE